MGSRHDRGSLPDGEEGRLDTVADEILKALKERPRTNKYFSSRIALYYGRRVRDLRKRGYWINVDRVEKGIFLYTLMDRPDPDWEVDLQLTLPDGRIFSYTVDVQADNVGKARNCAQHKDLIIKVLRVRPSLGSWQEATHYCRYHPEWLSVVLTRDERVFIRLLLRKALNGGSTKPLSRSDLIELRRIYFKLRGTTNNDDD